MALNSRKSNLRMPLSFSLQAKTAFLIDEMMAVGNGRFHSDVEEDVYSASKAKLKDKGRTTP